MTYSRYGYIRMVKTDIVCRTLNVSRKSQKKNPNSDTAEAICYQFLKCGYGSLRMNFNSNFRSFSIFLYTIKNWSS